MYSLISNLIFQFHVLFITQPSFPVPCLVNYTQEYPVNVRMLLPLLE